MTDYDYRCIMISYHAEALKRMASDWHSASSMTLGEVDLISAERKLKSAISDVQFLLAEHRKWRKESA